MIDRCVSQSKELVDSRSDRLCARICKGDCQIAKDFQFPGRHSTSLNILHQHFLVLHHASLHFNATSSISPFTSSASVSSTIFTGTLQRNRLSTLWQLRKPLPPPTMQPPIAAYSRLLLPPPRTLSSSTRRWRYDAQTEYTLHM